MYSKGNDKASRAGCYPSEIAASPGASRRQIAGKELAKIEH